MSEFFGGAARQKKTENTKHNKAPADGTPARTLKSMQHNISKLQGPLLSLVHSNNASVIPQCYPI